MEWIRRNLKWLIPVVAVVLIVIGLVSYLAWRNGIENEGERQQNNIVKLQTDIENEISNCLDKGAIAAQVAQQEFATLKDVLVNVTAARYEGGSGALSQGGPLISALQENYPQIDQSTWKTLMGVVVGCRDDIRDRQERLQGYAANFRTWYMTGGFLETTVRNDFPTDALTTIDRKSGAILKGKDALDYLTRVISIEDAKKAMENGTLPSQKLFPTSSAPPTSR